MTFWSGVRASVSASTDSPGQFLAGNLAWLAVAALTVTAGASFRPAYVLTLLVVPVTCGLMRVAAHAARGDLPRVRHFVGGARHRIWAHLGIGAAQGVVLAIAVINIGVGMTGETLVFALVAVFATYVALATVVLAVALWPLLLDPERRDVALPTLFRLALAVITRRPLSLVVVALALVALLAAIAEIVVLGLLLPSFGLLVAAHLVLPTADRLHVAGRPTTPPRSASDHG
jgi:hypothetical protein